MRGAPFLTLRGSAYLHVPIGHCHDTHLVTSVQVRVYIMQHIQAYIAPNNGMTHEHPGLQLICIYT